MGQLGLVARLRFLDARTAERPVNELLEHLNSALHYYHKALALLPRDAVDDLAVVYGQVGTIYGDAGDIDRALAHFQNAIRYHDNAGDIYDAANVRFNVALVLANAGRFPDARLYAVAALRNFETYGNRAAAEIQDTHQLIADIDRLAATKAP